jgi:hypothetical protein
MHLGFPISQCYTVYTRAWSCSNTSYFKNAARVILQMKKKKKSVKKIVSMNNAPARHIRDKELASRYSACRKDRFANTHLGQSDDIDPRHPKSTTFIRSHHYELQLGLYISSSARKYTTNARGSKCNDESVG